jgi:hypothetical protein
MAFWSNTSGRLRPSQIPERHAEQHLYSRATRAPLTVASSVPLHRMVRGAWQAHNRSAHRPHGRSPRLDGQPEGPQHKQYITKSVTHFATDEAMLIKIRPVAEQKL